VIGFAWIRSRGPARTNRGRHSRALAINFTPVAEHTDECFPTGGGILKAEAVRLATDVLVVAGIMVPADVASVTPDS
jgi:hypothetical protein